MKTIKGFVAIDALADNTDGIVAPFGELSAYSTTFSKDRAILADSVNYPAVRVISFSSKDEAGAHIAIPAAASDMMLQVGDYIRAEYAAGNIPTNASKAAFITTMEAVPAFSGIVNIAIGELLAGSSATYNMPDFVRYEITVSAVVYECTLWFADAAFRGQFDEYEIIVIPPETPIDNINADTAVVSPLLAAFTASAALTAIGTAISDKPATLSKIQQYTWHDPAVPSSTLTASFAIVIYGAAGNDVDRIKEAIKNYIADNSVLTNWPDVFPDLYAENEFVFMPRWDHEADAGGLLTYPIYNPTMKIGDAVTIATSLLPSAYATAVTLSTFLGLYLEASQAYFRSLGFLVVGSPNNTGAVFKFSQRFADYTALDTTSADFDRMGAATGAFVLKFAQALEIARTMTASSSIPAGFSRVTRDGRHFVGFNVAGDPYTYLVISKLSFDAVIS